MFGFSFNRPDSVFYVGYREQLAATIVVNILAFSHGIATGWIAPMLLKLQSNDSPLEFEITVEEASWIGALVSIGGFIGNLVFGYLLNKIGRKPCIYLVAVPHMCFWTMVFFASETYHFYIARILGGMTGGGIFTIIPLYVSEIADCQVRGRLGSLFTFTVNVGILSGFIISSHVPYLVIPCVIIVLPVIYLLVWIRFSETPQHLLRKGLTNEAEVATKFYKNFKGNSKEEVQKFDSEFTELKMAIQTTKTESNVSWKVLCTKKNLKAIGTGTIMMFINMFSGVFCIVNYSSMIFAETGSNMDPNTNTIIIGAIQIIGSSCATILVDKYGRRILLLLSLAGMSLGMTVIGANSYLAHRIDLSSVSWLPVVVMSFVIFSANIGIVSVLFVVLVEILPPKIRSIGSMTCMALLSVFAFIVLKLFPILMVVIGLSGVMWMCASVTTFGFVFVFICIREMKGKSLDNDGSYE